jgi:hypothetical protein
MVAYKTLKTLTQNGTLTLEALPFPAGAQVEVIVLSIEPHASDENPYSLHGTPYRYQEPFEPVAQDDWDAVP